MPIYEYYCKKCDQVFDVMQKISESPLTHCPGCQQPEIERWVSAPGVQFKGSGWYETDYKKKKTNKEQSNSTTNDTAVSKTNEKAETTKATQETASSTTVASKSQKESGS